ncbi:hypothetical protein BTJ40_13065 [Microbulbifer sp. A4B17]|nr:hypothetical protein BTJ40_13065 [Microbulbifer sp. A4B17]
MRRKGFFSPTQELELYAPVPQSALWFGRKFLDFGHYLKRTKDRDVNPEERGQIKEKKVTGK